MIYQDALSLTGVLFTATALAVTVWAACFMGIFRNINIEQVRERMIQEIKNKNPNLTLKQIIDVIFETDFRILYKKTNNLFLYSFMFSMIGSNALVFISTLARKFYYNADIYLIFDVILVAIYAISFVLFLILLIPEIIYHQKFHNYHRELEASASKKEQSN